MSKVHYQRIRSLQDVKIERLRVENELDAVERRLRDDYRGISKMFSVGYLMEQITGKANLIYNIVQWSMSGYICWVTCSTFGMSSVWWCPKVIPVF